MSDITLVVFEWESPCRWYDPVNCTCDLHSAGNPSNPQERGLCELIDTTGEILYESIPDQVEDCPRARMVSGYETAARMLAGQNARSPSIQAA